MQNTFNINKQDLFDKGRLDEVTLVGYIPLSEELRSLFSDLITDENETVDLQFEYWTDKEMFRYNLVFEDDTINVNDRIESDYFNSLVKEFSLENR